MDQFILGFGLHIEYHQNYTLKDKNFYTHRTWTHL